MPWTALRRRANSLSENRKRMLLGSLFISPATLLMMDAPAVTESREAWRVRDELAGVRVFQRSPQIEGADLGIVEDVLRRTDKAHFPALHHHTMGSDPQATTDILLDQQNGTSRLVHLFDGLEHFFGCFGIQTHRRLIKHHKRRVQ